MGIDFTTEKEEILQYRFLDSFIQEEVINSPECVAFWYSQEEQPVSIAVYGLDKGIARLLYLATMPSYQMRGYQSRLQKYAESTLAQSGITEIEAHIYPVEGLFSNAFNVEGQRELLEYYGFLPKDGFDIPIYKFKNVKSKLLGEMTPEEFDRKMNKTYDILANKDIKSPEELDENEQGLFVLKDKEIKCGIIYEESGIFDLRIKKVLRKSDAKFLLGSVIASYIVNHTNINDEEFSVFTEDESILSVVENIAGKPTGSDSILCYSKDITDIDEEYDSTGALTIYDKWTMEDNEEESTKASFDLLESPCITCKYHSPDSQDTCKKYEEIPWEILVCDRTCDKYQKN